MRARKRPYLPILDRSLELFARLRPPSWIFKMSRLASRLLYRSRRSIPPISMELPPLELYISGESTPIFLQSNTLVKPLSFTIIWRKHAPPSLKQKTWRRFANWFPIGSRLQVVITAPKCDPVRPTKSFTPLIWLKILFTR